MSAVAAFARFLHPVFAAKPLKRFGSLPDFTQCLVFHVLKTHARYDRGRVTGKDAAVGRDEHEFASPSANTGFGKFRVVIGNNEDEPRDSSKAFLGFLQRRQAIVKLFPGGQQILPIGQGPTVILHARKFHTAWLMCFDHGEHGTKFVDVAAVEDEIKSNTDTVTLQPAQDSKFTRMGVCPGDFVGTLLVGTLEAELEMIEARVYEFGKFGLFERQAAGNQTNVKATRARSRNEFDDIWTRQRLAAGEVRLNYAEVASVPENTRPFPSGQFRRARSECLRVGTIDTVKRAAVREFCHERHRL